MSKSSDQQLGTQGQGASSVLATPSVLSAKSASIPESNSSRAGYGLRIAVLVLGVGITAYIVLQIQMIYSSLFGRLQPDSSDVAGASAVVVILLLMALAAIWGAPLVSMILFGLAAALAFHIGRTTFYGDMGVWGGVAVLLSLLSAADWLRRRGFSLDRHPIAWKMSRIVLRVFMLLLAVALGILLMALLLRVLNFR